MRDPLRNQEMLELVQEIWQREPDLRLGQLIFNAARMGDPELQDICSIEDDTLRIWLLRYVEHTRRTKHLNPIRAIIWGSDVGAVGAPVTVEAENLDDVKRKLE